MNANQSVADIAARKLIKESDLIKVALKCPHKYVRSYAINRITDQKALACIVETEQDEAVCLLAVVRLKDQDTLAQLATQNKMPFIRLLAVERLTNQALLKQIAKKDKDRKVQVAAIEQLTDEAELISIVRTSTLRERASHRLKELAAAKCDIIAIKADGDMTAGLKRDGTLLLTGKLRFESKLTQEILYDLTDLQWHLFK